MEIDESLLNRLTEEAKVSPRLRTNYDLRNSSADSSQRMLNAMEPGTLVPVHRHRTSSETVVVIRGAVRQNFYDEKGTLVESFVVRAGSGVPIFVVPIGAWHNSVALESGTIIFESKDGAYEPQQPEDIMSNEMVLRERVKQFIEEEARSLSMEVITPEYIYRMWGGSVPLEEIKQALRVM